MNFRRIKIGFFGCAVLFCVSVKSTNDFLYNVKNCYCSADWICKDFEQMSLPDFIVAWQQLIEIISFPQRRWFYAYDSSKDYAQRARHYSNFERYDRESLDSEWLKECDQYHQFLVTYYFDTKHNVIRKKEQKVGKKPIRLNKRYVVLEELVSQMAPQAYFAFYLFFFEQLANVMLKKLNYLYHEDELDFDHVVQLFKHQNLMTRIYRTCLHKTNQASAVYAHKMAYHYDRIESVLGMVVSNWWKRLGL